MILESLKAHSKIYFGIFPILTYLFMASDGLNGLSLVFPTNRRCPALPIFHLVDTKE